jgi:DNA-binding MarR family transcriptional regulator
VSVPSPEEREFVDRMGLFFEMLGTSRTMGRIYGQLMVCEPSHQSITELARSLDVSKASISTVVRQLEQGQMVQRVPVAGSRQHHYQLKPGGWAQILRARVGRLKAGADAAEYGLSVIGLDRPEQRERLHELRDFLAFVEQEYGEAHVRRWEDFRTRARHERAAGHDG